MKLICTFLVTFMAQLVSAQPAQDVYDLISDMHEATKAADHETYFGMFTDDAVFFGTDIWERWPKDEFESLYKPYMQGGNGWWFQMRDRHVDVQPGGTVALFDETLFSEAYGQCRGSGACRLQDGEWKITRYHLDITMPNGVSTELVEAIREFEADNIELMTFNIRYGTANDGINAWSNRRNFVCSILRNELPDVAGLQEALISQIHDIELQLPGYKWIGAGRDDGKEAGELSPIFYNSDKLNIVRTGTFWFSDSAGEPGSTSYGNTIPRICTWAEFETVHSTSRFMVANIHLDHQSSESRLESMNQLRSAIGKVSMNLPYFVMGDFNCTPDSDPAKRLIGKGWKAAVEQDEAAGTFHGFTGEPGSRIDMILVPTACEVTESEVITLGGKDSIWPSDHFPVRAIVNIKPMNE
jgi:endonuclease/exonuclease/phosphatase family metal-dependent hydrolase/ketosteroid isomerase-like protein